jgi:hypothetical protein
MLQNIQAGWYGADGGKTKCHDKYPKDAPAAICGHISLIELDGQMSYKQALAFWATGDEQYARNAFEIIDSWAKVGGVRTSWSCTTCLSAGYTTLSLRHTTQMLLLLVVVLKLTALLPLLLQPHAPPATTATSYRTLLPSSPFLYPFSITDLTPFTP